MAIQIKMPNISQTTDEVRLISWLIEPGDRVAQGDPLCEVETDKVTLEVESLGAGTVLKLCVEPDTVVTAGTLIAVLGEPGEPIESDATPDDEAPATASSATEAGSDTQMQPEPAEAPPPSGDAAAAGALPEAPSTVKATLIVRNLARKMSIDLLQVRPTGAGGLITRQDLTRYQQQADQPSPPGEDRTYALTLNQLAVARTVSTSKVQIPHFYVKCTILADSMLQWRDQHGLEDGTKVQITSLLVHAASRTLRDFPRINGCCHGDHAVASARIHIGFAVDASEGLFVPVIHNADRLDILDIDRKLKALVAKARAHRLDGQDLAGGTFTISNLGMYPVDEFSAIIHPTQAAVLAVGRIAKGLHVGANDAIRLRAACTVTGSFDHRIINGAEAAAFLTAIKTTLE